MKMFNKALTLGLAAAAVAAVLAGCGGSETVVTQESEETPEEEVYEKVSGEYEGETGVKITLPGGEWEVAFNNEKSTMLTQGEKTLTASIIADDDFDSDNLPRTKERLVEIFGGNNVMDVLEFSFEETERGTNMLRYVYKSSSDNGVITNIISDEIVNKHTVYVVESVIKADADDAEIETMKNAVNGAVYEIDAKYTAETE